MISVNKEYCERHACVCLWMLLGAIGEVKSGVLGARKATSVRHRSDGEEISQSKETDP